MFLARSSLRSQWVLRLCAPGFQDDKIDAIVRNLILNAGYPDYNHATGHAIGQEAHGLGAILGNKGSSTSALKIQSKGVYTIEPRIAISNGGSVEEMILAEDGGGVFISPRQKKLYLIQR